MNTFDPKYSNSALMDMGVYCVSLMLELFGYPNEIQAKCEKILSTGFMKTGEIIAQYTGFEARLLFSKTENISEKTRITFDHNSIEIEDSAGLNGINITDNDNVIEHIVPHIDMVDLGDEIQSFIECCKTRNCSPTYEMRSIATMKILDEAHKLCGIEFGKDKKA